jgi:SAM-dependent methyltransferase
MSRLDADYFDRWYADMRLTHVKEDIVQRHLGLPPDLLSTSLLPWEGIADLVAALGERCRVVVDLACGRGGYGLEVARRTGARLVGVDFSAEAVRLAVQHAAARAQDADFRVGDLAATGLDDAAADAVMVVDAIQFADPPAPAYTEIHRILRPGGRVVLTAWETESDDQAVPARLRAVDLGGGLTAAGFQDVEVVERPDWRARELAMWTEAAALDPGEDPALQSFHDEGARVLAMPPGVRRMMATATR